MDGMNKEKWAALSSSQKRQFIWDYYKIHMIVGLCLILGLGWFIHEKVTHRDPVMNVIMLNTVGAPADTNVGFQAFLEENGYEVFPGAVAVNSNLYIDFEDDPIGTSYSHYQALYAIVYTGQQDLLFGTGAIFQECMDSSALVDLSQVLPREFLEKHKDKLLYTTELDTVAEYPCAITLKNHSWLKETGYYYQCSVGVLENCDQPELAVAFLEYLLNMTDMEAEGT